MSTRRELHVLVVDDDAPTRDLVEAVLGEEGGFRVESTADAQAALAALSAKTPDVVLLDIMMPEMSGLDLMTEIRRRANVPIIFLSARGGETERVRGLEMGADDYVVKPFSCAELVARITSVIRG